MEILQVQECLHGTGFFAEINRQIGSHGLLVKKGAIVDAAIVESSRKP